MADRALTEDEVADLKEAFAMFDINGDGGLKREIIDLDPLLALHFPQPHFQYGLRSVLRTYQGGDLLCMWHVARVLSRGRMMDSVGYAFINIVRGAVSLEIYYCGGILLFLN
jgi:Ca2+-binding EF-hand superfamily protein